LMINVYTIKNKVQPISGAAENYGMPELIADYNPNTFLIYGKQNNRVAG
jgi:hypothetical protein